MEAIKTLQDAIIYFSNPDNCISYLVSKRWPDGVVRCPNCDSSEVKYMAKRRVWQCKNRHPKHQFSIKVGTIYEDSAIGIDKWLVTTWLISNCKNGISSYEIAKAVGVTQRSAWFMLHRVRHSMVENGGKIGTNGRPVEMDETYIGGKVKNMHRNKRPIGTGFSGKSVTGEAKTIVVGMLERKGRVRAKVVAERTTDVLQGLIKKHIANNAVLITDEFPAYKKTDLVHEVVNHANEYVRGHIHTNGIENFWSLLKRGLHGTYISVEPFHLQAYVAEQVFRYNNRKDIKDVGRFNLCVSQGIGRRLTYKQLTGKEKAITKMA